jgi:dihydroneopterin aldolase
MGTIKLKNIQTYSYHGCLIEEGKIGSDYSVDLEIKLIYANPVCQMI